MTEETVVEMPPQKNAEKIIPQEHIPPQVEDLDANWSDVSVDNPPKEVDASSGSKLRVSVIGDNYLADAMRVMFDTKLADVYTSDDITRIVETKPQLVFVCNDVPLLKNESIDDVELIATLTRLSKETQAGVCLKTTVNTETLDRIASATGTDWFMAKFIYSPEVAETAEEIIVSDYHMIGGGPNTIDKHEELMLNATQMLPKTIIKGTVNEIAFTKLGLSGFKAVKQTFFNQFHQAIIDIEGANPSIVRRNIEKCPSLTDNTVMIPTFIRAQIDDTMTLKKARSFSGEYTNTDVKMFASMTDRLSVLEECINLRNLKD